MARLLLVVLAVAVAACSEAPPQAGAPPPPPAPTAMAAMAVPAASAPRDVAVLEIDDLGEIHIELLSDVAPVAVAHFIERAGTGYYDGTTFHRVIPGFAAQGGCTNTRNRDPRDDGRSDTEAWFDDEISGIGHQRGIVSMANRGRADSNGAQFFITLDERPDLDAKHTVFGRVISGMEVVDAIEQTPTDAYGRHGPRDRPLEDIRVVEVRIETATAPAGAPAASAGSSPLAAPATSG